MENMPKHPEKMELERALELAVAHHQAGRFTDAENIYNQILQTKPDHFTATHMLGVLAHQTGKNELAIQLIKRMKKR